MFERVRVKKNRFVATKLFFLLQSFSLLTADQSNQTFDASTCHAKVLVARV